MTRNSHSEITCPLCSSTNSVTTGNIPEGTELHCSTCQTLIARWETDQHQDNFALEIKLHMRDPANIRGRSA